MILNTLMEHSAVAVGDSCVGSGVGDGGYQLLLICLCLHRMRHRGTLVDCNQM